MATMETKKIKFFKQDNKWYADVPNHTLEENEMVMGADIFLEWLANGKKNVELEVVTEEGWRYLFPLNFTMKEHDDDGATYSVWGYKLADFINAIDVSQFIGGEPTIWLCNVAHDIFGEHPKNIYIFGWKSFD